MASARTFELPPSHYRRSRPEIATAYCREFGFSDVRVGASLVASCAPWERGTSRQLAWEEKEAARGTGARQQRADKK
jgi:hypothetical protein